MNPVSPSEQRFASWLEAHGAIPRKLSRAYAPTGADAAELHQEMLVQLWRSVSRFKGQAKASTWIYRVCLNTALTWRRGEDRRRARVVVEPEAVEASSSGEAGPAENQDRRDLRERLFEAVRALPTGERTVTVLALDGLSYGEIAAVTGMTENHVGVTLNRARQRLAQTMKGISDEL